MKKSQLIRLSFYPFLFLSNRHKQTTSCKKRILTLKGSDTLRRYAPQGARGAWFAFSSPKDQEDFHLDHRCAVAEKIPDPCQNLHQVNLLTQGLRPLDGEPVTALYGISDCGSEGSGKSKHPLPPKHGICS